MPPGGLSPSSLVSDSPPPLTRWAGEAEGEGLGLGLGDAWAEVGDVVCDVSHCWMGEELAGAVPGLRMKLGHNWLGVERGRSW